MLAREPVSLFKNGIMRKPDKPSLRKIIMSEHDAVKRENMQTCDCYVVDGGALLHRVRWSKDMKFSAIAKVYINYVTQTYNPNTTIVYAVGLKN